jgi:purine-cytosine permease-like protein
MKTLNFKLILQLSLFGLAMGVATVFVIPSNVEPVFWLIIFGVCAVVIARRCSSQHFLHGFMVSLANCVWITTTHIALCETYLERHPQEAAMMKNMPLPDSPRLMMLMMGPVIGVVSGLVLGLFALIAGKLVKPAVA